MINKLHTVSFYISLPVCLYMCVSAYLCVCTCAYQLTCVFVHVCISLPVCLYMCASAYLCVCTCAYLDNISWRTSSHTWYTHEAVYLCVSLHGLSKWFVTYEINEMVIIIIYYFVCMGGELFCLIQVNKRNLSSIHNN